MSNKVIHVLYNDDDVLLDAVQTTRSAHHHIEEVYTPFPVHGLDKAMGLAPTRIAICAFLYGIVEVSVLFRICLLLCQLCLSLLCFLQLTLWYILFI
jgi:hypothetical protein